LTGDPPTKDATPEPVHDVIDRLCDADPARRPGLAEAYAMLGAMLAEDDRPWPEWATTT
jgi:hypothetical protein